MNPFYSAMNKQNSMQMLQKLKSNPVQFLMEHRFNLPQNIDAKNPQAIINYLVSSGQVPQETYNKARQIAQQMGMK